MDNAALDELNSATLDEFDRVLAAKMSDHAGPDATMKAKQLYGRVRIVADTRDMENGEEFFTRIINPSRKNYGTTISMLAKCYQTLIDEGKI